MYGMWLFFVKYQIYPVVYVDAMLMPGDILD